MPQTITTGYRALVDAAEREIETLTVEQALALYGRDDVTFIDIRDVRELEREGRMPGAFHCPRGMLEFWIDPESPYHKPVFAEDNALCSFAPAAGVRRWPRKPRIAWACVPSPISKADTVRGAKRTARMNRRQPSQAPPSTEVPGSPSPAPIGAKMQARKMQARMECGRV